MNPAQLLAHFERISDAPDAVPRLRRFILDLAVRGKLVPQEPKDGPASALLKRIAAEKARLVKAGDIRKPRDLDTGVEVEEPFPIPPAWRWVRLDTVGAIVGGGTPSAAEADNFAEPGEGIPWLTPADLGGHSALYISRGARDLSEKGLRTSSATLMPKGTVLFTSRAPIGYIAIAANPISTNQGFKSIVPYVMDCSRFIATAMKAFAPAIDAKAPGTTFKEVSGKIVAAIPFPLPPLAEQRRIVARVDELMALCDRLETIRTERESRRDRLAASSLARLDTPDPDTFDDDARFALDVLPAITARPDGVRALRQTILNLAVCGKLVAQDPKDEPASTLLRRSETRKSGKHEPTQDNKSALTKEVAPFLSPRGWEWVAVRSLLVSGRDISYGVIKLGTEPRAGGIPTLRCSDVKRGFIDLSGVRKVSEEIERNYVRTRLIGGEILINIRGTLGGVAKVPNDLSGFNVAREVAVIPVSGHLCAEFLVYAMLSSYFWGRIQNNLRGIAYKGLNLGLLRELLIALPPLAEQYRIVAKVDELMALCNRLEISLQAGEGRRSGLLMAILGEALCQDEEQDEAA